MRILVALIALAAIGSGVWFVAGNGDESDAQAAAAASAIDLFGTIQTPSATPQAASAEVPNQAPIMNNQENIMQATLHTNLGDITIEFYPDAPNTVANFTKLAGAGFYNGTKFHRVIKGFMIQGGDPLSKDDSMAARWGTGGPDYKFADEIHTNNQNAMGTIAMANSGPNTNGSQFFINVAPNNFLDPKHTVFGKVIDGMEVVTAIENTPTSAGDRPVTPMVIESVTLK